ncbi:MAG TPA: hypothetical protein VHW24_02405 [Bryobacteraceae bacterium]|nr:hypothetical protein [Bryobacteraceae bacterium]
MKLRVVGRILAFLALTYAIATVGLYWATTQPPEKCGAIMPKCP